MKYSSPDELKVKPKIGGEYFWMRGKWRVNEMSGRRKAAVREMGLEAAVCIEARSESSTGDECYQMGLLRALLSLRIAVCDCL